MKALLAIALAASLGFNVFFALGYYEAREEAAMMQSYEGRARLMTRSLDLTEEQLALMETLVARAAAAKDQAKQAALPEVARFLAELAKDAPDEQVLREYAELDRNVSYRKVLIPLIAEFTASLTPEQRTKFIEQIRMRASPDGGGSAE